MVPEKMREPKLDRVLEAHLGSTSMRADMLDTRPPA
jgi:hypothetical protein